MSHRFLIRWDSSGYSKVLYVWISVYPAVLFVCIKLLSRAFKSAHVTLSLVYMISFLISKLSLTGDAPGTRKAISLTSNLLGPVRVDLIYVMSTFQTLKSNSPNIETEING